MSEIDKDILCRICPALRLPEGDFNIEDPDSLRDYGFDKERRVRLSPEGIATCVHPDKIGRAVTAIVEMQVTVEASLIDERKVPVDELDFAQVPTVVESVQSWANQLFSQVTDEDVFRAMRRLESVVSEAHGAQIAVAVVRQAFNSRL